MASTMKLCDNKKKQKNKVNLIPQKNPKPYRGMLGRMSIITM